MPSSSIESSTGVFSTFRKRFNEQFHSKEPEEEEVLSFLVNAEMVGGADSTSTGTSYNHQVTTTGKRFDETSNGADIARVDVYCRSGTVCTIRVIQTGCATNEVDNEEQQQPLGGESSESIKTSYSLSPSAMLSSLLPTPRTGNNEHFFSSSGSSYSTSAVGDGRSPASTAGKSPNSSSVSRVIRHGKNNAQVRRIFRRKVNLESLKRILTNPPTMNEISTDIVQVDDDTPIASAQTVVNKSETTMNLSYMSNAQQRFLQRERKKYNKRVKQEEKARQKMANLVLSGGSFTDLTKLQNAESKDTMDSENQDDSSLDSGRRKSKPMSKQDQLRQKQMEIQRQIELADMGLAIILGEVESVEKMMAQWQSEQNGAEATVDDDDSSNDESDKQPRDTRQHPREGKREKKHRGREGKKNSRLLSVRGSSSCSRSISTASKRQNESFSTYDDDHDDVSDEDSSLDDSEAEEIARMLQGCEVEYSFPHEFHDELEDALLAQEFASDEDSETGDDTVIERRESMGSGRRDRTRHRGSKGSNRMVEIPTIVAVPTNGHGCIVLRNNGAFSTVGNLPKPLYKELFRKRAPFPEYIALGTKGRYYVRFEDGTHKCAGPQSLKAFINGTGEYESSNAKKTSRFSNSVMKQKTKKGQIENRHNHSHAIACIAFGRKFDEFFLVRNDGSWECNGDMPESLDQLLADRRDKADLEWVSLGPNNEWCLKARNDRIWWGGVSEEVDDHLSRVLIEDEEHGRMNDLKFIDFGVNDTFFLLYQ